MLDSFSAFSQELPASARSAVPLTGDMLAPLRNSNIGNPLPAWSVLKLSNHMEHESSGLMHLLTCVIFQPPGLFGAAAASDILGE